MGKKKLYGCNAFIIYYLNNPHYTFVRSKVCLHKKKYIYIYIVVATVFFSSKKL